MITIYAGYHSRALHCRTEQLAHYLNQISPLYRGLIHVCEGKNRYAISADVARALAYDFIYHGFATIQACGESFPIEDENDLINVFRKMRTERLYLYNGTVLSSGEAKESVLREIAL